MNQQQREINRLRAVVREYELRLREGRNFLMSVTPQTITVEDTLYAFGWERNGLNIRSEHDRAH